MYHKKLSHTHTHTTKKLYKENDDKLAQRVPFSLLLRGDCNIYNLT